MILSNNISPFIYQKSRDNLVLSAVCASISIIAKDKENLAVLTDHKVIPMLASLVYTTDDKLRENLAAAIASCSPYGNNTQELGRLKTVTPIGEFDILLLRTTYYTVFSNLIINSRIHGE